MDLKPFKLDIDELINEFAECESATFVEFKRVWLSRKFSYIFEASPSYNQGFFMQSLYAHSIGYMVSAGSLSKRLGGLYCLYCLYETQPFKPPFKIYLSLGELRQLKGLAVDAKLMGVKVVSVLLKSMLEKNVFLFGFVGVNEGSVTERVNELTDIQNARVQTAYKKLFADSRLEHFIHMDMGKELDVDTLKKRSSEYAMAKELAIKAETPRSYLSKIFADITLILRATEEAGQAIDVKNIKHIAENKRLIGDIVEEKAADWNFQKELFYEQTGSRQLPGPAPPHQEANKNMKRKEPCNNHGREESNENFEEQGEHDNFGKELEEVLLLEPLECDDEEAEPADSWEEDT